jgi:hypothetical protein
MAETFFGGMVMETGSMGTQADSADGMNLSSIETCIRNCTECYQVCLRAVSDCLQKGGEHAEHSHITLMLDCARICQTSAEFMLMQSPLQTETCDLCADICEECADECEEMTEGDQVMEKCAEVCRRCAESCRSMSEE